MTSIQRPGGPTGPAGSDPSTELGPTAATTTSTASAAADPVANLAAAVDTGAVPPRDAIASLIEDAVAGLPADQAAELRAAMTDLLAHDPYLSGLARDLGAPPEPEAIE